MKDLKVRGVPVAVIDLLKKRAAANGRSLEAEMRLLLESAVQDAQPILEDLWVAGGFVADEIVPERVYHLTFSDRVFRLMIHRRLGDADKPWFATVDEAVDAAGYERIWAQVEMQPADALRAATARECLQESTRWMRAIATQHGSPEQQAMRNRVEAARKRLRAAAVEATSKGENVAVRFRFSPSKQKAFGGVEWTKEDGCSKDHASSGTLEELEAKMMDFIAAKRANSTTWWDCG